MCKCKYKYKYLKWCKAINMRGGSPMNKWHNVTDIGKHWVLDHVQIHHRYKDRLSHTSQKETSLRFEKYRTEFCIPEHWRKRTLWCAALIPLWVWRTSCGMRKGDTLEQIRVSYGGLGPEIDPYGEENCPILANRPPTGWRRGPPHRLSCSKSTIYYYKA